MEGASRRILVVDDYEPWRRFVSSTLQKHPEYQVIGEASDGLEAIQQAEKLQPDVILLDISLPRLNGIDAAVRILESCPGVKILFVSQESSADILQRALAVGAHGYIVKAEAGSDLLKAVEAVLRDDQFVSDTSPAAANTKHPASVSDDFATFRPLKSVVSPRHNVLFYSDDDYFLNAMAQFVGTALTSMNSAIVIATESHRNRLLLKLQACGLDVDAAIEEGRYIPLDAVNTASRFMVSDRTDPALILKGLCDLFAEAMKAARGKFPYIAACGECSTLVCGEGKVDAAIEVERLTNRVADMYEVDLLCGYTTSVFQGEKGRSAFERIRAEHSVARFQDKDYQTGQTGI